MTDRIPLDHLTSDALDQLYDRIATLEAVAAGNKRHVQLIVPDLERAEAIVARIQDLADEYPAGIDTALIHEALDQPAPAPAATEQAKAMRILYERWVKAGPPPLGTSMSRWWDKRLVELHQAILPPVREQKDRPTHPDGTPYQYAEITAEGWGYCDGCRTWSTGTPERPHQCPETHMRLATNQVKEK